MKYTIYKTTNNVNGKIYIGQHKTDNPNDDYLGSGKYLLSAIEKYGRDKFTKEVLYSFESKEEADNMEAEIVDELFVSRLDTYNIKVGGTGGFDYIQDNNLSVGFSVINERLNEDKEFAEFHKEKRINGLRFYYKSLRLDNERYQEFVYQAIKRLGDGFLGRSHTEEAKRKIGEANSKHQSGKGNSQYGTVWVCKGNDIRKIKNEYLDEWISMGYHRGRK